jgi:hypothetical protein
MIMDDLLRHHCVWRSAGPGAYATRALEPIAAPWIASATLANGHLTVTATHEALEREALELATRGPAFLASNRLTKCASTSAPRDWPASAAAYAGEELTRLWLARTPPGERAEPDAARLARQVLSNPPYAVLYAHAAAAAVLRWAGSPPGEFRPGRLTEPGESLLLDALSWLPERVATAARRGRPDVLARHLEIVASRTIDIISTRRFAPGPGDGPGDERLWLVQAARTGLSAGLDLLGIIPPERL